MSQTTVSRLRKNIQLLAIFGLVALLVGCNNNDLRTQFVFTNNTANPADVQATLGDFGPVTLKALQPASSVNKGFDSGSAQDANKGKLSGSFLVAGTTAPLPELTVLNGNAYGIRIELQGSNYVVKVSDLLGKVLGSTTTPKASGNVNTTFTFVNNTASDATVFAPLGNFGGFAPAPIASGASGQTTFSNALALGAGMGTSAGGTVTVSGVSVAIPTIPLLNGTNVTFTISGNPLAVPSTLVVTSATSAGGPILPRPRR